MFLPGNKNTLQNSVSYWSDENVLELGGGDGCVTEFYTLKG